MKNSCKFGLLYTFSGSVKTYKKGNAEDKEINSEIELKNIKNNAAITCFFLLLFNNFHILIGKLVIDNSLFL